MVSPKLLELLVCPVTKGRVEYDRENSRLVSRQAKLAFPIVDGVPDMRLETALTLNNNEMGVDEVINPDDKAK